MKQMDLKGIDVKNTKGYMLMEALISIAIFAIGFLAVATLVFSATRNNTNGNLLTNFRIVQFFVFKALGYSLKYTIIMFH